MRLDLKLAWVWASLYAIAGGLSLGLLTLRMHGASSSGAILGCYAGACFAGVALTCHFSQGRSSREGVVAAFVLGLAQLLFSRLPGGDDLLGFCQSELPLSTALMCAAGGVAGSRVSIYRGTRRHEWVKTLANAWLAGLVLLGAFYVSGVLVLFVRRGSPALGGLLGMAALFFTPGLAGFALQCRQRVEVETLLVKGLALLGLVLGLLMASRFDIRAAFAIPLMCIIPGMALYLMALPGILYTRTSKTWAHTCKDIPRAVVVQDSPPGP